MLNMAYRWQEDNVRPPCSSVITMATSVRHPPKHWKERSQLRAAEYTQEEPVLHQSCLRRDDSRFLANLRGLAIIGIVLDHLGGWIFPPYTGFIAVIVPVFFFVSGSVSYCSFLRSSSTSDYLHKRLVGLLIPYYLACLFCILVYVLTHLSVPTITLGTVVAWLTICPTQDLEGFPLGQVWFLHTLAIIVLISPLFFALYARKPRLLFLSLLVPLALSAVQVVYDVHAAFIILGQNLYKPAVHCFFFIAGFVYFSTKCLHSKWFLSTMTAGGLLLAIGLVFAFDLRVDYTYHTFSPDLYYVAGSAAAIGALLLCQDTLLRICANVRLIAWPLNFAYRYTFSIFLLHSFAIWAAERYLGLVSPQGNYVLYAIAKSTFVMVLTCILAIPFARACDWLIAKSLRPSLGT
jgi:peptidoglycan/LPS O-acetylase OafA/YrhL